MSTTVSGVSAPPPADLPAPASRAAQQAATRQALIDAAHRAFARDGFHGASLESIAREAGYSKGAVYSNFAGKVDLFLSVLDGLLARAADAGWDPIAMTASDAELAAVGRIAASGEPLDEVQLSRGFGLATLEMAAAAGRDPATMAELRKRLAVLVDGYAAFAGGRRQPGEHLSDAQLGLLLAAFDQGFSLFAISGWSGLTGAVQIQGVRRLLRSLPEEEPPPDGS